MAAFVVEIWSQLGRTLFGTLPVQLQQWRARDWEDDGSSQENQTGVCIMAGFGLETCAIGQFWDLASTTGLATKTVSQGAPLPTEHSKITILHGIGCSLNLSISYCSFVFRAYMCSLLSMGKQSIGKLCHMSGPHRPQLQKARTFGLGPPRPPPRISITDFNIRCLKSSLRRVPFKGRRPSKVPTLEDTFAKVQLRTTGQNIGESSFTARNTVAQEDLGCARCFFLRFHLCSNFIWRRTITARIMPRADGCESS